MSSGGKASGPNDVPAFDFSEKRALDVRQSQLDGYDMTEFSRRQIHDFPVENLLGLQ